MPSGKTDAIAATFNFDVRGTGIPGGNTPISVEVGNPLPMLLKNFDSFHSLDREKMSHYIPKRISWPALLLLGEELRHIGGLRGPAGFAKANGFQSIGIVTRAADVIFDAVLKERDEFLL